MKAKNVFVVIQLVAAAVIVTTLLSGCPPSVVSKEIRTFKVSAVGKVSDAQTNRWVVVTSDLKVMTVLDQKQIEKISKGAWYAFSYENYNDGSVKVVAVDGPVAPVEIKPKRIMEMPEGNINAGTQGSSPTE